MASSYLVLESPRRVLQRLSCPTHDKVLRAEDDSLVLHISKISLVFLRKFTFVSFAALARGALGGDCS